VFNFFYNQEKEVIAQNTEQEESIICQNRTIDYSQCVFKLACGENEIEAVKNDTTGEKLCCPEQAIDNLYEIPIGRTTDTAELLSEQMLEQGETILNELGLATEIDINQLCPIGACQAQCNYYPEQETCVAQDINCADLGDKDNIWQEFPVDQCQPKCSGDTPKCCKLAKRCLADKTNPCAGKACSDNLFTLVNALINQTNIFQEKTEQINESEEDIKNLEENLAKSRLRLYLCSFVSTEPEQALERGYTGLMDCPSVLSSAIPIYSVLDNKLQFGCYGSQYCQIMDKTSPCANDYFCCR